MHILIVEREATRAATWARLLTRRGADVDITDRQGQAVELIRARRPDILIVNVELTQGSALAIADFAAYRTPSAQIIFVSDGTFFSDGSIFRHAPNACAFLPACTRPEDLCAMVDHHARVPEPA
jgi:DNA-binding response OmpR family regulator